MNKLVSKFIIYGNDNNSNYQILSELSDICAIIESNKLDVAGGELNKEVLIYRIYNQIKNILKISTDYAFDVNLWQSYLTFLLMTDENPFSLTCEKVGANDGSVNLFAKNDFRIFIKLFNYNFSIIEETLGIDCFSIITNYKAIEKKELMYNKNVSQKVSELRARLAKCFDEDEFFGAVTEFYKNYGVGMFGLNKAFRIIDTERTDNNVKFCPINNMDTVMLDDLIGYEIQKKKLIDNTLAFVEGRKANNVLLFGDSGTGKSTSVKAIVNEFYDKGLRMIEIYKHQFKDLSNVIAQIKNRNYRFIIYMDDLSFEEFEIEYKFLKAVIEGGVETKPENILIYATSNRRHLIKETWNDRSDVESGNGMHRSDTMEEKLSLVRRFGISINYSKPSQKEYFAIVIELARRAGIELSDEKLCMEANKWELSNGGISGRTAQQFINYLLSKEDLQ